MARITFSGLDGYMEQLNRLGENVEEIVGKSIYQGADILANEVKDGIDGLKTDGEHTTPYETDRRTKQKEGLKEGFGIAKMQNNNGFSNVLVGFEGYNSQVTTKKYPQGQPNKMVARIFNSGTSFNRKQPFFDKAVRMSRKKVQEKMKEVFEGEVENIMKE